MEKRLTIRVKIADIISFLDLKNQLILIIYASHFFLDLTKMGVFLSGVGALHLFQFIKIELPYMILKLELEYTSNPNFAE